MAFVPRTFEQILVDMIAYVQSRTELSDFSPGSVIRSLLEACALEDDEQYFQMVQLLDAFSYVTASGEDLDKRMADFGIPREPSKRAFGQCRFFDKNLIKNQIGVDAVVGALSIQVFDSTRFPISGYPYTIRIAEGTSRVQDVIVTNNNATTGVFTLDATTPLLSDVYVSDRVALVTGSTAATINAGETVEAPPTTSERSKTYTTQEPAYILAGNLYSNEVLVKASDPGVLGNVGLGRIKNFLGNPPFSGAGVTNTTLIRGGTDRESDADFRQRALERLQSMSRGTPLSLKSLSVGVEDPETGQRVTSSYVLEAFDDDEVIVYVDDGTGLEPDTAPLPANSLNGNHLSTWTSLTLYDGSNFPTSGWLLIEEDGTNAAELIEYVAHPSPNTLTLAGSLSLNHDDGSIVNFVDVVSTSTETGQRRFRVQNYPVVRSTTRIFVKPAADVWRELSVSEFVLNKGTGEFIIVDEAGLYSGSQVVAHYTYYTNLVAEVQKVLEGDPNDAVNYPGVKAAGIFLAVEAPVIKRVTIAITLTAEDRFRESDLVAPVRRAIEDYVNSHVIGQDVIRNKIIDVAFNTNGVKDVTMLTPTSNIVVLENELPVPFDSDGNSLVTIL